MPQRRVEIGCGEPRSAWFGWLAIPLNLLPGWGLSEEKAEARATEQSRLRVARSADELRGLLGTP